MRVVMTCAGTGGHINPAIAIANIIRRNDKHADIIFIGTKTGLENELVKNAGYEIKQIRTGKFLREITLKNFSAIVQVIKGIGDAKKIIKEFKPDIVIGTGGYICGPVMLAAKHYKIPYILHESNSYPGISVKLLAKGAKYVFIGFSDAKIRLKNRKNVIFTGTPTKFNVQDMLKLDVNECKKELNLTSSNIGKDKKIVFITGGSQGARKFNEVILNMVEKYKDEKLYFVLVTGQKNYDLVISKLKEYENEKNIDLSKYIVIKKFVYEMDKMYNVASLCITRSGAMTINELAVCEKPSILVPFPYATENHQLYNAKVLENAGASEIILEKDLNEDLLYEKINSIISDENKLKLMGLNASKVLKLDTEKIIYDLIKDAVRK